MGKSTKDLTQNELAARKLSSKHLRDYRKNDRRLTQEAFAEVIGREKQAVARYEKGKVAIPSDVITRLVSITGYIQEYWEGRTECKTLSGFVDECESDALQEFSIIEEQAARKRARIQSLMALCEYGYEDFSDDKGPYAFAEFSEDPSMRTGAEMATHGTPHKVTLHSGCGESMIVYLSNEEMNGIIDQISDLIAFRCFQKSRGISMAHDTPSSASK